MLNLDKKLDDAARELLLEFDMFLQKERIRSPHLSKSVIFESWALQRISNMQVAIVETVKRLDLLEQRIERIVSSSHIREQPKTKKNIAPSRPPRL